MDPDSKLMMEQMGFAQFTAKWQNNKWEEEEMEVKEEKPTFRFSFLTECCSRSNYCCIWKKKIISKYP